MENTTLAQLILEFSEDKSVQNPQFIAKLKQLVSTIDQQAQESNKQIFNNFKDFIHKQDNVDIQTVQIEKPLVQQKVKRLYVDGCFDMMHSGHYNALRQAKQFCETLVVGVIATDEIEKRKGTPVMSFEERLILVESCKWVDEVVHNTPYDPTIELIDSVNCSHVGHGDDLIIAQDGTDAYLPFKQADRMIIFKRTEGISSTDIVGRLLLMSKQKDNQFEQKQFRKMSGDQGVQASKIKEATEQTVEQVQQPKQQIQIEKSEPSVAENSTKTKLLNTTRRIRQFSAGNREAGPNDKVIYIDGSFDMLHIGHILTLKKARALGDYLIVGLHDDDTINAQKGSNYPILSLQERVLNVLAMKYVDEVIIGAPWKITDQMIKQFNICKVVQGSVGKTIQYEIDHYDKDDPYLVPKQLGIYEEIQSESTINTEVLIERIIKNRLKYIDIYNKKAQKQETWEQSNEHKVKEV